MERLPTRHGLGHSEEATKHITKTGFDDGVFTLDDGFCGGKGVMFHGKAIFFENDPLVFVLTLCFQRRAQGAKEDVAKPRNQLPLVSMNHFCGHLTVEPMD